MSETFSCQPDQSPTGEPSRLFELLWALVDGQLTEPDRTELEQWIGGDLEARQIYVRFMQVCADLRWRQCADERDRLLQTLGLSQYARTSSQALASPSSENGPGVSDQPGGNGALRSNSSRRARTIGPLSDRPRQTARLPWLNGRLGGWLAAAAVLLAVGIYVIADRQNFSPPTDHTVDDAAAATFGGDRGSVAQLTATYGARWAGESASSPRLRFLSPGDRLNLQAGVAEITYETGVKLILQGPAVFRVTSPTVTTLEHGQLVAHVPRSAVGFVVRTPQLQVVDLGTEFGVSARSHGHAEVHVFKGQVETQMLVGGAPAGAKLRLSQDQAVRFDDQSAQFVMRHANDGMFVRSMSGANIDADVFDEAELSSSDIGRDAAFYDPAWHSNFNIPAGTTSHTQFCITQFCGLGPWRANNPTALQPLPRVTADEPLAPDVGPRVAIDVRSLVDKKTTTAAISTRYLTSEWLATQPHRIRFLVRVEQPLLSRLEYVQVFDNPWPAYGTEPIGTWGVRAAADASGRHMWVFLDGNGVGQTLPISSGVEVVAGKVYEFQLEIDPARGRWKGRVSDGLSKVRTADLSGGQPLGFRADLRRVGGELHFGARAAGVDRTVRISIGGIEVQSSLDGDLSDY